MMTISFDNGKVSEVKIDEGDNLMTPEEIDEVIKNGKIYWDKYKVVKERNELERKKKEAERLKKLTKSLMGQKNQNLYTCFMTFHPHLTNLSVDELEKKFRLAVMKYYQHIFGKKYTLRKDEQYDVGIFHHLFEIKNKKLVSLIKKHLSTDELDDTHVHLHTLWKVEPSKIEDLYIRIYDRLLKIYPSLTGKVILLDKNPVKQLQVFSYVDREENHIITKQLLQQRRYKND